MRPLLAVFLLLRNSQARICGNTQGLGGKFKHLQHPGTYKEDCEYRITTKTHLAVKISFEKPVPCEKARVKVIDKNGEYGPFCTILNNSEADRNQNLSTLDEKYFRGPDVSVVFMPGGNKRAMRLRLNFEWHTVNQQDFECHVASFQKTNDVFSEIIGQNGRFEAKSMWSLLSKSIASFGENFVADYEDFCKLDAAHPDCDLVELRGTESLEKAMHKMENLIRHITTNCVKGFGYRWFDAFNRLAYLTGLPTINNWTEGSVPFEPALPISFSDISFANFEALQTSRTVHMNVQTTKPGAQKTHLTKGFKCSWDLSKKNGCHIKDLKECQLPVFEESLNSHIDDPEYNCDFEEAVIEMGNIFSYISALSTNSGPFSNQCAKAKAEVSCSLVNVNTDFNKVFKPLTYIRKMRGMARKLTSDCQNTHRDEIQAMFQDVWASIKLCGENMTTDVMMITQRGLTLPGQVSMASPAEIELDDLDEIREKDYCRIIGYHGRNLKTFLRRTGNTKDPEKSVAAFERVALTISNVAQKVQTIPNEVCFLDGREGDRIPCDFAFFPKNEEACQLTQRVARVVEYISDRCAVLLPRNIDKHIADLKKASSPRDEVCPDLGIPMSREIRQLMPDA